MAKLYGLIRLSGLTAFYRISGFRGLGALSQERDKGLGPDLVRVE
jgi:hypothetical protein